MQSALLKDTSNSISSLMDLSRATHVDLHWLPVIAADLKKTPSTGQHPFYGYNRKEEHEHVKVTAPLLCS